MMMGYMFTRSQSVTILLVNRNDIAQAIGSGLGVPVDHH
jgi:hypothetical protein